MNNFVKVNVYASEKYENKVCFSDIKNSLKHSIIININHIASLYPKETWGFCENEHLYPYRILDMADGTRHYLVLESGNILEELLIDDNKG